MNFYCKFTKMILDEIIKANFADNSFFFERLEEIPTNFFDNYHFRRPELALYSFYDYQKMFIIIKSNFKIEKDNFFNDNYLNPKKKIQQLLKKNSNTLVIALIGFSSINKAKKIAIQRSHPEIRIR